MLSVSYRLLVTIKVRWADGRWNGLRGKVDLPITYDS